MKIVSFALPPAPPLGRALEVAPDRQTAAHTAIFTNWNDNVTFRPLRYLEPASVDALRDAVATSSYVKIRGAGHSMSDIMVADEETTLIGLNAFKHVSAPVGGIVTIGAGATLGDIAEALAHYGVALAALPSHPGVTLGGAIATGSHGTATRDAASISELLTEIDLVDANGELRTLRGADLDTARTSFGSLGAIYQVKLRVVPAFDLVETSVELQEPQLFAGLPRILADNQHVWMYWKPAEKSVVVRTFNRPTGNEPPMRRLTQMDHYSKLTKLGGKLAYALLPFVPNRLKPALKRKLHAMARAEQPKVGRSDYIFFGDYGWLKGRDVSCSVPIEDTAAVMTELSATFTQLGFDPNVPVSIRFLPASDRSVLAMNAGRAVAVFELLSVNGMDDFEAAKAAFERVMAAHSARPHWGKELVALAPSSYPASSWQRFADLRQRLDPHDKFTNDWVLRSIDANTSL